MKSWKVGRADEPWKVEICMRDAKEAADALRVIQYVIGVPLQTLTGAQIESALRSYIDSCEKSISNGKRSD